MPLKLLKSTNKETACFLLRISDLARKRKVCFFAILLLIFISIALLFLFNVNKNIITKRIFVDNIYISGINKQSAIELLEYQLGMRYNDFSVKLKYGEVEKIVKLHEIAFKFDIESTVSNAFILDKQESFFRKILIYCGLSKENVYMSAEYTYDKDYLKQILEDLRGQIDQEEKSATVNYKNGTIILNNETIGRYLNIDSSIEMIENCINEREFSDIDLVVSELVPEITYEDVKEINSVLSSFSTIFNVYDLKRTNNIKIACDKINNTVVKPGYVFSTDLAIGRRTVENGYMDAPIILNNELTQGLGGGVCQVTTTLYNSVLKAKLKVEERTHHSMPLAYVSAGLDATIAEDLFDFKFSNNKESAICVIAEVTGNSIQFKILGKKEEIKTNVVLKTEVIAEYMPLEDDIVYDSSVPKDDIITVREARNGLRVIVYRETYDMSGKLIESEQISIDTYQPVKAIIKMNPIHKVKKQ